MVPHSYTNASENLAQYRADLLDRQEVTVDWYLDHMCDASFFRYTSDEDAELGLDEWRYHMDMPIEPEDAIARGWRIFVQRKDMPEALRTKKRDLTAEWLARRDERTEAELEDAAHWRWATQ